MRTAPAGPKSNIRTLQKIAPISRNEPTMSFIINTPLGRVEPGHTLGEIEAAGAKWVCERNRETAA